MFKEGNCSQNQSEIIKSELIKFIDTVKTNSIKNGKYNVYTMKIVDSCVSFGMMCNSYELNYISLKKYYFQLNDDLILALIDDSIIEDYKAFFNIKLLEGEDSLILKNKLLSKTKGFISGIYKGELLCFDSKGHSKTFYRNTDDMPVYMWAFDIFPQGGYLRKMR
jgi:hypothetical protein